MHRQEIEVFYVIPALRKELAVFMKKQGLSQKETAKRLAVTEAAVSQYVNKKRGSELKLSKEFCKEIKKSAKAIKTEKDFKKEIQKLLRLSRKEHITCKACKQKGDVDPNCKICFQVSK